MIEQEGVIKYQLDHTDDIINEIISLTEINAWRTIMHRLGLIGQTPGKYAGYGFGNISQRLGSSNRQFIISGTQTGHLESLSAKDYCLILDAELTANKITSRGLCKPSSEALTHAAVYQHASHIQCIIHVHCTEIWTKTEQMHLPHTNSDIAYGTPEMAKAVEELLHKAGQLSVFSMLGHEDGIIAIGSTMQQAAWELIKHLSSAIAIDQK
jgi:ribulose-5-phosphate 4-epimerase/fuculose-1-phosphate aldolase